MDEVVGGDQRNSFFHRLEIFPERGTGRYITPCARNLCRYIGIK